MGTVGAEVQRVARSEAEALAIDIEFEHTFEQVEKFFARMLHGALAAAGVDLDGG